MHVLTDNVESDGATQGIFSMAPDGLEDYLYIHSAFMAAKDGELLLKLYDARRSGNLSEVVVQIGRWPEEAVEGSSKEAQENERKESSLQDNTEGKSLPQEPQGLCMHQDLHGAYISPVLCVCVCVVYIPSCSCSGPKQLYGVAMETSLPITL